MNKILPAIGAVQPTLDNYTKAAAITPSDSTVVAFDAIYVGGTGAVTVDMSGSGSAITFSAVPVGTILKIGVAKVKAATTATLLIGLNL